MLSSWLPVFEEDINTCGPEVAVAGIHGRGPRLLPLGRKDGEVTKSTRHPRDQPVIRAKAGIQRAEMQATGAGWTRSELAGLEQLEARVPWIPAKTGMTAQCL